jgi:hypothetical protein
MTMQQNLRATLTAACTAISLALSAGATACTLFAAAGEGVVEGGGTLVAKVRDWSPVRQSVRLVKPAQGYAYYGLVSGRNEWVNMAVNEKGLYAAISAAGSVPNKLRQPGPGGRQVDHLIRNAASVREAMVKARDFTGATNIILADRHEVAFIEVLPGGTVLHKATSHGTLAHTNHYVLPESEPHNGKIAQTSLRRYERIRELLAASPRPMNLESFEAMIRDRNDGPDNSIWRTGTETSRHRTISASAAQFMPDGSVRFFITYRPSGNEDFVTVRTTVRPEDFRK